VISLYVLMKLKWFYCRERLAFLEKINELSGNFPPVILTNMEIPEMDGIQTVQHAHTLYPDGALIVTVVPVTGLKIYLIAFPDWLIHAM
jgi:hypothetical protein